MFSWHIDAWSDKMSFPGWRFRHHFFSTPFHLPVLSLVQHDSKLWASPSQHCRGYHLPKCTKNLDKYDININMGVPGPLRNLRKWMHVIKRWSRQTDKLWWTRIWKYTCSSFSFLLWHLYLWTDDRTSEHNELKTGSTTSGRCVCSTATATATYIETDQGWPRTRIRTPPSCSSPPSSGTSLLSATNFQGAANANPLYCLFQAWWDDLWVRVPDGFRWEGSKPMCDGR